MSEFHIVDCDFKDEECLVGALRDMDYTVEVHDEQVNLNGYAGSGIAPKAHIVVRKNQFRGYGDAGFERVDDGFKLHVDDYDYGRNGADKIKMGRVKQLYSARVIEKTVRRASKYTLLNRKEKDGEIKIRVRRMGN